MTTLESNNLGPELNNGEVPSEEEIKKYNVTVLQGSKKDIVWSIIKQLKVGGEVKHLQLPPFLVQPESMLEHLAGMFSARDVVDATPDLKTPDERMLNVVKVFFAGLHSRPKGVKKPLNPVIGEVFYCSWDDNNGQQLNTDDIGFVGEQISHHPPWSAFCYHNIKKGVAIQGNFDPSYVKFLGNTAESIVNGKAIAHVIGKDFEEDYITTWPSVRVRGIIVGALMFEFYGSVKIHCPQTGYSAEIEFKSKKLFRGKYNEISGKIVQGKNKLYKLSGIWDQQIYISKGSSTTKTLFFDNEKINITDKKVAPIEQQAENESRKFWSDVVRGIVRGNEEEAMNAKKKIEEEQRKSENDRKVNKIEHVPKHFVHLNDFWQFKEWETLLQKMRDEKQTPLPGKQRESLD